MTTTTRTLAEIQAGDPVVRYRAGRSGGEVLPVERATKAYVAAGGTRYHRRSGRQVGDGAASYIIPHSPDVQRVRLAGALAHYGGWYSLRAETLERIHALITGDVAARTGEKK